MFNRDQDVQIIIPGLDRDEASSIKNQIVHDLKGHTNGGKTYVAAGLKENFTEIVSNCWKAIQGN